MIALLLAAVAAGPPAPFFVEAYRPSPKHPQVLVARRDAPDAALYVQFRTGAADEREDEQGVTRLAQHAMLGANAVDDFASFATAVYDAGGSLEIDTSVRRSGFLLVAPKGAFDALAARLLKMALAPRFTEDGFPAVVRRTMNDQLEPGGQADLLAFVAGRVLKAQGTSSGGEYNNPLYGDPEIIRELGLDVVARHVATKMTPANAVVVAAGAFDERRLRAALAPLKGGVQRAAERPDVRGYLPIESDSWSPREVHLHLQVVDVANARDMAAAHLLAQMLDHRVRWTLRDQGLAYATGVMPVTEEWMDFLVVFAPVSNTGRKEVLPVLQQILADVQGGGFTDAELAQARGAATGALAAVDADPARLARALAVRNERHPWIDEAVVEAVRTMDRATLTTFAGKWLSRDTSVNFLFGRTRSRPAKPKARVEE